MTDSPTGEDGSVTASDDPNTEPSSLDDAALLERIKRRFREARSASSGWRKEAREDYGFYSGEQWASEDVDVLKDQMRPVITFNRVAPTVDTVGGMEVNNRQEIRCYPRVASSGSQSYSSPSSQSSPLGASGPNMPQPGAAGATAMSSPASPGYGAPNSPRTHSESDQAECLSNAIKWVRDECDAEDEESDMFMDSVICGMGWTDTRLDYEVDPDGMLIEERVDPLEMFWDPYARKRNLSDARFVMRRKEIDVTWDPLESTCRHASLSIL